MFGHEPGTAERGAGAAVKQLLPVSWVGQGRIGAGKQGTTFMAIDESTLTKGQMRKLNALRRFGRRRTRRRGLCQMAGATGSGLGTESGRCGGQDRGSAGWSRQRQDVQPGCVRLHNSPCPRQGRIGVRRDEESETMTTLPVAQPIHLTGWQAGTSGFRVVVESKSSVLSPKRAHGMGRVIQ